MRTVSCQTPSSWAMRSRMSRQRQRKFVRRPPWRDRSGRGRLSRTRSTSAQTACRSGSLATTRRARSGYGIFAPLSWLFELLRGPAAGITTPGVRWHDLLVCAIDGSRANLTECRKQRCNNGGSGYRNYC